MSAASRINLYAALNVSRRATTAEIVDAFRAAAAECHPDRHVLSPAAVRAEAEERFKRVNEAREILSDPVRRRDYDAETLFGTMPPPGEGMPAAPSFDDIFSTAMASLFSRPIPPPPRRAEPSTTTSVDVVKITLEDVAEGGTLRLHGELEIDIPPGVLDGTVYRVKLRNGRQMAYSISVGPHAVFSHDPGCVDITARASVSLADALTGAARGTVTDLYGRTHSWSQDPRLVHRDGDILATILGAGLPVRDVPGVRGNILVRAKIDGGWPERPLTRLDLARAGVPT